MDDVISISPKFATFVFSKFTSDFCSKMELLEKTLEKAKLRPESYKDLDFTKIDHEILARASPILK